MKSILKFFLISFLVFSIESVNGQSVFVCNNGEVTFFSAAPVENIEAINNGMHSILNTSNNEIVFVVPMRSFKFKKSLMEEHFNEKYVESDKYPNANYQGKINETIDFTKDGEYDITSTGVLALHGIDQQRTEKGKLSIKNGIISLTSDFKIAIKEFNIEIPKLVIQNIAEVVDVKFTATYSPYKKEQ